MFERRRGPAHHAAQTCIACGSARLTLELRTSRLEVSRCRDCHHRIARHEPVSEELRATDYHQQPPEGVVESLERTRRRQSLRLLEILEAQTGSIDGVLDFGSGRGWFVETLLARGARNVAGADTSELAVQWLQTRGAEGVRLDAPNESGWSFDLTTLSFRPRVLTMLDVLEHFEPQLAADWLRKIVSQLSPQLEWVLVKVPDANGLLYRTARALAAVNAAGPYEQLFQVGTWPPHCSYFTSSSMRAFAQRLGLLECAHEEADLDFEPETLSSRAASLQRLPRALIAPAARLTALAGRVTGWMDSHIFLMRVRQPANAEPLHPERLRSA